MAIKDKDTEESERFLLEYWRDRPARDRPDGVGEFEYYLPLLTKAQSNGSMNTIRLDGEQEELLSLLVEADRRMPRDQRAIFDVCGPVTGSSISTIIHRGLSNGRLEVFRGDIEILDQQGLLIVSKKDELGNLSFYINPRGFEHYRNIKMKIIEPTQRVESTIKLFLSADRFQKDYPHAFQKWIEAESKLWTSDTPEQFTTIGLLCREAMQEFATKLVERNKPLNADENKAHDVARIKAVLNQRANQLGITERPFLEALVHYWGTVTDLVQRQVHGNQKGSRPLIWEDGRRIVFQTAVVMFEVDSAISRS